MFMSKSGWTSLIQARLDPGSGRKIRDLAKKKGCSVSTYVREILYVHLGSPEVTPPLPEEGAKRAA